MPSSKLKFESMGIGEMLIRGRLKVPLNQRAYAWEENNVQDLFQDLNLAISSDDEDYFLGTIVLIQEEQDDIPSIADGQQRLATTTILLARIRDYLYGIKRSQRAVSIDHAYLRKIDIDTEDTVPRLKLNVENHEFFVNTILASPNDESSTIGGKVLKSNLESNQKLMHASRLAEGFIKQILATFREEGHADQLVRWIKFIEKRATIVVVTVSDETGAYRIFETLNDRGLKASQADILKNYFFSRAGERLDEASGLWNATSGSVETLPDDDERLITYLRHLWITSRGPTKERELAAAIKKEIPGETKTMQFLADARDGVSDYVALWSLTHPKWLTYKNTTPQHLHTIHEHLKVKQIRPLLFAVAHHFDPVEADKAFRLLVSWSVRFLIFGGRGGLLDRQYALRAQEVGTRQVTKARELRDKMREYVPTDREFEEAFSVARVSKTYLARYYLRALDKTLKDDPLPEYVANEDEAIINLEHVLPLKPSMDWQINVDDAQTAEKMLGNMVLLNAKKNSDIGNDAFSQKKLMYRTSAYEITRQVSDYNSWGLAEIRERQAKMAKTAVQTWPLSLIEGG